ncbi:MAG: Bug family tripartite tricarboxylate transporter substrate binding protein [Pseudomonadota bacterium]|jgi:tripartite-type tricarboxylate transporter receptor subunit TctC
MRAAGIRAAGAVLVVLGGVGNIEPADAQSAAAGWPARPVRMIVASPPAGPSDILARLVAPQVSQAWGQPVLVDNRSGANGMIAGELTARSDPDGHTFLLANAGFVINTSLYAKVPYDPLREFQALTLAMAVPNILVVHPSLPVKTVAELVAWAKARPDQLAFASAGSGSSGHLALELFQQVAGIRAIHVPFKGGGPALADVMAGQSQALFSISVAAMPQIRAGKVRAVAATSLKRLGSAPEVPTVAESGYPGFEVTGWFGFVAPVRVPREVAARMSTDLIQAVRTPEVGERLSAQGAEIIGSSAETFGAYLRSEQAKWAKVIRQAGIKPQ